jgi:hypothetical protein
MNDYRIGTQKSKLRFMCAVQQYLNYISEGSQLMIKHFFLLFILETPVFRCLRKYMAKRLTYNIITGHDPRLRMCFYYSPYFGQNIWRRGTSLTGERTKKDPAFKGFRQCSRRLKEAQTI